MADNKYPHDSSDVRASLAVLCAIMVKTLNDESPGFQAKFKANLTTLRQQINEYTGPETLEVLGWVRDMLKI